MQCRLKRLALALRCLRPGSSNERMAFPLVAKARIARTDEQRRWLLGCSAQWVAWGAIKTDVNKPVSIISYERTASNIEALKTIIVDLLVCDEAHRLKNVSGSKTLAAMSQISCGSRRVLLTGTPIQNKYLRAAFATSDNQLEHCSWMQLVGAVFAVQLLRSRQARNSREVYIYIYRFAGR